ncbi:MAG: hypothetical protein PHX25_01430 [Candidatus Pacebacteria bacterium]|nr:hypothetical protein [Candidatus Paceibacterota bacterium]
MKRTIGLFLVSLVVLFSLGGCGVKATNSYGVVHVDKSVPVEANKWLSGKRLSFSMDENTEYDFQRDPAYNALLTTEFLRWGVVPSQRDKAEYWALVSASDYEDRKVVTITVVNLTSGDTVATSIGESMYMPDHYRHNYYNERERFRAYRRAIVAAVAGLFGPR